MREAAISEPERRAAQYPHNFRRIAPARHDAMAWRRTAALICGRDDNRARRSHLVQKGILQLLQNCGTANCGRVSFCSR